MRKENHRATDLLEEALIAMEREAGVRLEILQRQAVDDGDEIDATLTVKPNGQKLFAEVKKWAQQANLGVLINRVRRFPGEGILIADYVNPNMAERLREEQIQYIDTAGNAYLNQPGQFVYIKGNPAPKTTFKKEKDIAHRAFEPKALEVVLVFLCYDWIVAEPYRTIADRAGVAVGTVGWVIKALTAGGFIKERAQDGGRKLVNRKELLEKWVEAWPQKLKPKLHLGEFQTEVPYWWKEIDITKYAGYWGGEIAAAKYTNYLTPEEATVYLPKETVPKLLRDARLQKANEWGGTNTVKIQIYKRFWPKTTGNPDNGYKEEKGLVHPILAYADLVATGDTRNLETAKKLYDQHIYDQFIRED